MARRMTEGAGGPVKPKKGSLEEFISKQPVIKMSPLEKAHQATVDSAMIAHMTKTPLHITTAPAARAAHLDPNTQHASVVYGPNLGEVARAFKPRPALKKGK